MDIHTEIDFFMLQITRKNLTEIIRNTLYHDISSNIYSLPCNTNKFPTCKNKSRWMIGPISHNESYKYEVHVRANSNSA